MHILDLILKIKFIFSPIYVTYNNNIPTNQQILRCSHLTNVLEIMSTSNNKILKPKSDQAPINIDVKSIKAEIPDKLRNNIIINHLTWYKYCQEFLYISSNYPELNNFEDIVSKNYFFQNSQIEKSENKKNEESLKYSLLSGRIKVLYPRFFNTQSFSKTPIKYIWRKNINGIISLYFRSLYHDKRQFIFLTRVQNHVFQALKKQKFPVFIIVNGFNQIVTNEPEHLINIKQQFGDWLSRSTHNIPTLLKEYSFPLREAYIFINPIDAIEYYSYIKSQYPKSARQLQLKLFVGNLDEFYKINRLTVPYTQFRLLPDLKEVGKLVNQYQYKNNVHFDYKQVYGKNYFQGQPIYFIEPTTCKHIYNTTEKAQPYYFPNSLDLAQEEYNCIFTTYQDAMIAWEKYRNKFPQYSLYNKPRLTVYNMESFLQEHENQPITNTIIKFKFRFVPSQETYQYIKKLQKNTYSNVSNIISIKKSLLLLVQVWTNRIVWGMLRRNPPE